MKPKQQARVGCHRLKLKEGRNDPVLQTVLHRAARNLDRRHDHQTERGKGAETSQVTDTNEIVCTNEPDDLTITDVPIHHIGLRNDIVQAADAT